VAPFFELDRPFHKQQHTRLQSTPKTCAAASMPCAHRLDLSLPDPTTHVQMSSLLTVGSATSNHRRHKHMIMLGNDSSRKVAALDNSTGKQHWRAALNSSVEQQHWRVALERAVQSCCRLRLQACPRSRIKRRRPAHKAPRQVHPYRQSLPWHRSLTMKATKTRTIHQ
jgi:hypothetical protein